MRICRLKILNFRGVKKATLFLGQRAVLIGDNNTGKSTVLEALDLVLGPDRLKRRPPIDEHDFYGGCYIETAMPNPDIAHEIVPPNEIAAVDFEAVGEAAPAGGRPDEANDNDAPDVKIRIEAVVTDLLESQEARFKDSIEWWDEQQNKLYDKADLAGIDANNIKSAVRVTFIGEYDPDEDDFKGETFFSRTLSEGTPATFKSSDKRECGFLYLRSLRTGSRALSLEHGSLLDIILRLKELRLNMWEDTIANLHSFDVAANPKLGLSGVLKSINSALKKYVPREWGAEPRLKISTLTRENLRKVITAFISTGDGDHSAPYYRQGTGTINMLVLAMLSQIAEDKRNVIFAMEEPETAIPPYAQKRIVHELRQLAAQSIFTSHSPYVIEEFDLAETVVLTRDKAGTLTQAEIELPNSVRHKRYRQEFRTRFCEGLLARRILLAEGATESACLPTAARRLSELNPDKYRSLEALGVCTVDAGTESQLADLAKFFRSLGKTVFALCDKQTDESQFKIQAEVDVLLMHEENGFENLVVKNTTVAAKERFVDLIEWPQHLAAKFPSPKEVLDDALSAYFKGKKADWAVSDFLAQCNEAEIPAWIKEACITLKNACDPTDDQIASGEEPPPDANVVNA